MADKKERLSREEMGQAIDEGGSVLHEGRLIRTREQLKQALQTPEEIDQEIKELTARKTASGAPASKNEKLTPDSPKAENKDKK